MILSPIQEKKYGDYTYQNTVYGLLLYRKFLLVS